jgi:hypothetical protein
MYELRPLLRLLNARPALPLSIRHLVVVMDKPQVRSAGGAGRLKPQAHREPAVTDVGQQRVSSRVTAFHDGDDPHLKCAPAAHGPRQKAAGDLTVNGGSWGSGVNANIQALLIMWRRMLWSWCWLSSSEAVGMLVSRWRGCRAGRCVVPGAGTWRARPGWTGRGSRDPGSVAAAGVAVVDGQGPGERADGGDTGSLS